MSTFLQPPLDFDVVREVWCRYELADHAILKVKVVLTRVIKQQLETVGNPPLPNTSSQYSVDFQFITVVLTQEKGDPDTRTYSPQELESSIVRDDIRFVTETQDWNEYVADDGTRIKIQPLVMRVAKTTKHNARGEPVYRADMQATFQIKPPAGLGSALTS